MRTIALLATIWLSISAVSAQSVSPLPRISAPMEAIYKGCTHLGSYNGTDYNDHVIDDWVRSKGGNAVYTFDFNGYLAAAKCNQLTNPSFPESTGEKTQVSGLRASEALVRGCVINNHFQSNDLVHIRDTVLGSGGTDLALFTTDRPGYYEVFGYRCPR